MLDRPTGEDLLRAVVRFLKEDVMPQLDGAAAFKTRVAANALELVGREMAGRAESEAMENARLVALLGHGGDLESLNRELCAEITAGRFGFDTPGLSDHVWRTTLDKVAIEQPGYASYRRIVEQPEGV